jgi:hypothetical protein
VRIEVRTVVFRFMVVLVQYLLNDRNGLGIVQLRIVVQMFMCLLVFVAVVMVVMVVFCSCEGTAAIFTQNKLLRCLN